MSHENSFEKFHFIMDAVKRNMRSLSIDSRALRNVQRYWIVGQKYKLEHSL